MSELKKLRNKTICEKYLAGNSLEVVGREFFITRERVRQILVEEGHYDRHHAFLSPVRIAARERKIAYEMHQTQRRDKAAERRRIVRELYDAGASYAEIVEKTGTCIRTVENDVWRTGGPNRRRTADKPKRRLTPDDKEAIAKRYASGESLRSIADEFDICVPYIGMVANKLGYHRNHPLNRGAA